MDEVGEFLASGSKKNDISAQIFWPGDIGPYATPNDQASHGPSRS